MEINFYVCTKKVKSIDARTGRIVKPNITQLKWVNPLSICFIVRTFLLLDSTRTQHAEVINVFFEWKNSSVFAIQSFFFSDNPIWNIIIEIHYHLLFRWFLVNFMYRYWLALNFDNIKMLLNKHKYFTRISFHHCWINFSNIWYFILLICFMN